MVKRFAKSHTINGRAEQGTRKNISVTKADTLQEVQWYIITLHIEYKQKWKDTEQKKWMFMNK